MVSDSTQNLVFQGEVFYLLISSGDKILRIVYLGDIVAKCGREKVISIIPQIKQDYDYDALIVNVDNAAHGFGCTPAIAQKLLSSQVSAIVTGDHVGNQKNFIPYLEENNRIIRPLNYSDNFAGEGARIIPLDNGQKILVIEVVGRVFMDYNESYIDKLESILQKYKLKKDVEAIFIDIHAEATAEKQALAHYLDGRVSAVIGSHTHVPTSDCKILPKGTAYQTDVGMCGNYDGVIGFDPQTPMERLHNKSSSSRLEPMGGQATVCGVFIQTDNKTGLATDIQAFSYK